MKMMSCFEHELRQKKILSLFYSDLLGHYKSLEIVDFSCIFIYFLFWLGCRGGGGTLGSDVTLHLGGVFVIV